MLDTVDKQLNTVKSVVGRQAIFPQFMELKPTVGDRIVERFTKLLKLKNQAEGTPEAITPIMFKTHVFASLPDSFEVTSKIRQNNPMATLEEVIKTLKEDKKIRDMRTKLESTTDAFYTARGRDIRGYESPAQRDRGRGYAFHGGLLWCSFCGSGMHSTEVCRSKRQHDSLKWTRENTETECFYCGEIGHFQRESPVKQKAGVAKVRAAKKVKIDANLGEKEADAG